VKTQNIYPSDWQMVFPSCKLIAGMQKISAQTLELFLSKEHDKHLLFWFAANLMVPGIQSLQYKIERHIFQICIMKILGGIAKVT
jgi:hypothetical protein